MVGETLEITIAVSMIVLIAYPSLNALRQVMLERRDRRVRIAQRNARRRSREI